MSKVKEPTKPVAKKAAVVASPKKEVPAKKATAKVEVKKEATPAKKVETKKDVSRETLKPEPKKDVQLSIFDKTVAENSKGEIKIHLIPRSKIEMAKGVNPDGRFKDDIAPLLHSMVTEGFMQQHAIKVVAEKGKFILGGDGNRRLYAAGLAGIDLIPCYIVEKYSKLEMLEDVIDTNIQKSLTYMQNGLMYKRLLDEGMDKKEFTKKHGDQHVVLNMLKNCDPRLMDLINKNRISPSTIAELYATKEFKDGSKIKEDKILLIISVVEKYESDMLDFLIEKEEKKKAVEAKKIVPTTEIKPVQKPVVRDGTLSTYEGDGEGTDDGDEDDGIDTKEADKMLADATKKDGKKAGEVAAKENEVETKAGDLSSLNVGNKKPEAPTLGNIKKAAKAKEDEKLPQKETMAMRLEILDENYLPGTLIHAVVGYIRGAINYKDLTAKIKEDKK